MPQTKSGQKRKATAIDTEEHKSKKPRDGDVNVPIKTLQQFREEALKKLNDSKPNDPEKQPDSWRAIMTEMRQKSIMEAKVDNTKNAPDLSLARDAIPDDERTMVDMLIKLDPKYSSCETLTRSPSFDNLIWHIIKLESGTKAKREKLMAVLASYGIEEQYHRDSQSLRDEYRKKLAELQKQKMQGHEIAKQKNLIA